MGTNHTDEADSFRFALLRRLRSLPTHVQGGGVTRSGVVRN